MARISTYPLDTHLVGSDYWIGSDADSNYATKNFTIDSVAEYMNRVATQQQALRFKYTNTVPRTDGCFFGADGATSAPTVAYNTITGFTLSKFELTNLGVDISSFYSNPLGSSEVLMTQCDDVSRWAVFTWVSSVQNATNPNYYDIGVAYKGGNNGLIANKDYFISLLTYAGANDANFLYTLDGSASVYVIDHNLNKYPSVTIFDTNNANAQVETQIAFNSLNQATLTFSLPFTGEASFN
tara:strand:- start:357 stop:1076 length:720 start_codon:yes stop_codon:yes gene_type:complete